VEEGPFLQFARKAFAQKRKTLANNLRAAKLDADVIAASLQRVGIPAQARAEELSLEIFARLFRELQQHQR
jgi:16S rRNA (adenine1518-N6/adenine1519-N6)-dimethyltransferase